MLTIRRVQEDAMGDSLFEERLPGLAKRIGQYLIGIQVFGGEQEADEERDRIESLLRGGYRCGFRMFDSLGQYVAYWYILGEKWDADPAISRVLQSNLSEDEKWTQIELLIPEE